MLVIESTGCAEYSNRTAKIFQDDEGYFVEIYTNNDAIRQIDATGFSLRYAEDIVENWITGIIKE